ncbi:MAG TPA: protein-L-isoaspartate(D-aspartate) O-methyltransferase [Sedimentisphaerales bacterium]|nr:protein-L-isoaspartate(D-aspartate) O-methyltransferase [Sedimentisphaerales bacterium]
MGQRYAGIEKKWAQAILGLALLIGAFVVIVAVKRADRGGPVFAAEKKEADANEPKDSNKGRQGEDEKVKDSNEGQAGRPDHNHPAFSERVEERARMVAEDIEGRGVRDPGVLAAMRTAPRHAFVRRSDSRRAYADHPLPIGLNQTISQPYIVAYMTDALKLGPDSKVFEVGTGSGYQAAVCAEIAGEVYTVEILEKLAESARDRLKELGYRNVTVKAADGYYGWEEKGPFDAIIITAAAGLVPPPLIEQLKPGGRMILPLGSPYGAQWLVLITKDDKGEVRSRSLIPVRFVPMTGRAMEAERPSGK